MPLQKPNEVKRLVLPTSKDLPEAEQEWVAIECGPLTGGDLLLRDNYTQQDDFLANILTRRIQEWNIKGYQSEEVATINVGNVKQISRDDLPYLISQSLTTGDGGTEATGPKAETPISA